MAKVAVAVRLDPDVVSKVDAYAKGRKVSRQVVLESFVLSGLDDSGRGVPDLVEEAPRPVAPPPRYSEPSPAFADPNGTRQQRLNAQMLAARRSVRK